MKTINVGALPILTWQVRWPDNDIWARGIAPIMNFHIARRRPRRPRRPRRREHSFFLPLSQLLQGRDNQTWTHAQHPRSRVSYTCGVLRITLHTFELYDRTQYVYGLNIDGVRWFEECQETVYVDDTSRRGLAKYFILVTPDPSTTVCVRALSKCCVPTYVRALTYLCVH